MVSLKMRLWGKTAINFIIDAKSKGTIFSLFIEPQEYDQWFIKATTTGRDLVSYRYQSLTRIYRSQIKGTILNLFSRTGNHTNTIRHLSTLLPLGAISLPIDINRVTRYYYMTSNKKYCVINLLIFYFGSIVII